jgi:hypothetical protein
VSRAPRELALGEALGLGPAALARAEASGAIAVAASVVRGPAVVLGAGQRAGRVVQLDACGAAGTAVYRRATAGTAAYVGDRGIVWTLALPHVAALFPDATARTILNRNVRGFLAGLRRAGGGLAHYFGREWLSVRHRPAAIVGFEVSPAGAVLIEVIAGMDAPPALPDALVTDTERALDRWRGKAPAGLGEVVGGDALAIARQVMDAVAPQGAAVDEGAPALTPVTDASSPMPSGFVDGPGMAVPIGWIDTGIHPATRAVWLGGDVLVPAGVRRDVANGDRPAGETSVEGASLADLYEAVRRVRS